MAIEIRFQPPKIDPVAALTAAKVPAELAGAAALLKASEPLVPVDIGELVASGRVEADAHGASVTYSAVAPDGYDYAAIQHERLDYHHEHGQAKYLEQPMTEDGAEILTAVATIIAKTL